MMYSGNDHLMQLAKSYHSDLVSFCSLEWERLSREVSENATSDKLVALSWKAWCESESSRRTGYCIWVCSLSHFLSDADFSLATRLYVGVSFQFAVDFIISRCQYPYSMPRSSLGGRNGSGLASTLRLFGS